LKLISGWRGSDFTCKKNSYNGSGWGIPGYSNDWNKLPTLKKTNLLTYSPFHKYFQYPAYKPLLHPKDIKYSLSLKNLDYEHHSPPKQTAYKCSARKKQKM
jgi:hypothetical protein